MRNVIEKLVSLFTEKLEMLNSDERIQLVYKVGIITEDHLQYNFQKQRIYIEIF